MRAMILAAGRGARMGALTAETPKPLLKIGGRYLIEFSIAALVKAGIRDIVINICYQSEKIKTALGDGARYGANFHYSEEVEALETGGGIFKALPLLGNDSFIVLSSDIVTDYPLKKLIEQPAKLAHLILVDNLTHHPRGDFCLAGDVLQRQAQNQFTFGNIGLYHPELFSACQPGKFRLGDLLIKTVKETSQITGEYYQGIWHNVGTEADLSELNAAKLPVELCNYRGA